MNETRKRELSHDLDNALLTINGCVSALKNGYRFSDASAGQRIQALEVAAKVFAQAVDFVKNQLNSNA